MATTRVRVGGLCPHCQMRVSGVGDGEDQARERFENNMALHLSGQRCVARQQHPVISWGPGMQPDPYAEVGSPLRRRAEVVLADTLSDAGWRILWEPERLRHIARRRCAICEQVVTVEVDLLNDLPELYGAILAVGVEHHRRCPAAPVPANIVLGEE